MPARTSTTTRSKRPSRRTRIVWGTFVAAMTFVVGVLALNDHRHPGGLTAVSLATVDDAAALAALFQTTAPLDRERWRGIVIHHLGAPAGDPESIHRQHQGYGWDGLGYHFVIGNGNGLGDGIVHVGYRWNRQLPGVHATGEHADQLNLHTIGICLVGNGDNRPFTDRQISHLTTLTQRLQQELGIPAERVWLHRQVAAESSPGEHFPAAAFAAQLLDIPR